MPVALLNGDRELLIGPGLHLAHQVLLMLRQIDEAFRLFQFPQRQTIIGLSAHLLLAGVLRDHERHIVSKHPQGRAFRAFPGVNALEQLRHVLDGSADGHAVIGQDDELRPAVADLVGNVERPAGERYRLERLASEYLADAVVDVGARFPGIDVAFPRAG